MNDICGIYNIDINKIIEAIHNNLITCLYDSKGNPYVSNKDGCEILTLINAKDSLNSNALNQFIYSLKRNAFGEN